MACLNCNTEFDTNFCPNCGQKREVPRITVYTVLQNLYSSFADMDKGFLFNLKNLTLNPKKTVLNYIHGKRKQILNPINYAILTISGYLILNAFLKENFPREVDEAIAKKVKNLNALEKIGFETGKNLFENIKAYWFLMTFFLAAFTRVIFKRFNYLEHLVISFFVIGHATLLGILSKAIYHREVILFNFLVFFYMIFMIYKIFKTGREKAFTITMAVICVFFAYIIFFTIPILRIIYF